MQVMTAAHPGYHGPIRGRSPSPRRMAGSLSIRPGFMRPMPQRRSTEVGTLPGGGIRSGERKGNKLEGEIGLMGTPISTANYGITTHSLGSRAVAVSTIGYLCFGLAGWMICMDAAGWFSGTGGMNLLYPLSLVLAIMGILGFVCGRGLDSIVFFTGAILFSTTSAYEAMVATGKTPDPVSYLGWFACLFAIFFGYIWAGSFKSGRTRSLFLLGTWITMILAAIGAWTGATGFYKAAGYIGLITSAIAIVVSANEVIRLGSNVNPNLETVGPTVKPMAAD